MEQSKQITKGLIDFVLFIITTILLLQFSRWFVTTVGWYDWVRHVINLPSFWVLYYLFTGEV